MAYRNVSAMIGRMPIRYEDTEACADDLLERVDGELRLAAPLGLGKPHALLNALYRRVRERPERSLAIYTALSLTRPQPGPGLESRFLEPFLRRYFGEDAVDPEYARDQARDALPPNVRVHEFYMQSSPAHCCARPARSATTSA